MSLKELTAEKHRLAESTPFMKAVFAKNLPRKVWVDWTYQKSMFYSEIEKRCKQAGLLEDLAGIERAGLLAEDYKEMSGATAHKMKQATVAYCKYLQELDDKNILAHLYTWHLGDMFGGQMIKKIVEGPHRSLEFDNAPELMKTLREKLTDDLGPEANVAFDWAINIMASYEL